MSVSESKLALGIIAEKFIVSIVKSLFKANEGFKVKHTDFDNYNFGHGLDLRVFDHNRELLGIEVKNWKLFNKPYGSNIAETEIIDRFKNCSAKIKLLIISFKSLLTKEALRLLKQNNIHVIETNKLIGHNDFKTKLFYTLKAQIQQLLTRPCASFVYSKLTNYPIDNTINTVNIETHDTTLEINPIDFIFSLLDRPKERRLPISASLSDWYLEG